MNDSVNSPKHYTSGTIECIVAIQAALGDEFKGFLRGNIINAQAAIYLVEPDITVCCTPTILAFQQTDDATRFQQGFGGHLMTMTETLDHLSQAMNLHPPTGHHHHHAE